ncbi:hypothetical protein PQX77_001684 [Marasmius sp. AFHP31]|nr:hypothetical protein PQX77_001684 [Marasmius sp. AFHP31]
MQNLSSQIYTDGSRTPGAPPSPSTNLSCWPEEDISSLSSQIDPSSIVFTSTNAYSYQHSFSAIPVLARLCVASALDAPLGRTFKDVLRWLKSRTTAFCVHTPDDGTAIPVFKLKVTQEERVWVFFKVVSPNSEDGGTGLDEKMRAAAEACLPHNIFGEL